MDIKNHLIAILFTGISVLFLITVEKLDAQVFSTPNAFIIKHNKVQQDTLIIGLCKSDTLDYSLLFRNSVSIRDYSSGDQTDDSRCALFKLSGLVSKNLNYTIKNIRLKLIPPTVQFVLK